MGKVIITFLSPAKKSPPESAFISEFGEIKGMDTNDAPVKYFMLMNKGTDRVICFQTPESESAFVNLKHMIKNEFGSSEFVQPEVRSVPYTESASGINEALKKLMGCIEMNDEIYLDITGGFRHANYLTMLMLKFADFTDKRINVRKVIYANFTSNPKSISDITDMYKLFDLVNGAQNFMSFGNSGLLRNYFEDNETSDKRISELVRCMCDFSEMVSLCKINGLDKIISRMNELINEISSEAGSDNKGDMFFRNIIGVIKRKFGLSDSDTVNYPGIIRWCANNGLIQQALTLYVEKMPKYILGKENGIVKASERIRKQSVKKIYDEDYVLYFEHFLAMTDINDDYIKTTGKYISSNSSVIIESNSSDEYFSKAPAGDENIIHLRELLDTIYIIKKCRYSESGALFTEEEQTEKYKREGMEDLYRVVSALTSNPGSFKKFVNSLSSFKTGLSVFHSKNFISEYAHNEGEPNEKLKHKHSVLKKYYTVENIESVLACSKDFWVDERQDISELAAFMLDSIYIKYYLRNQINHAADETSMNAEELEYLGNRGYIVDEDKITLKYVSELIENSLNRII